MATKKKHSKPSGKGKGSKPSGKGRPSSSKKPNAQKTSTKAKAKTRSAKGKKPAAQKKSNAKSKKSSSSFTKAKPAIKSKKKNSALSTPSKKKKTAVSKKQVAKKVSPSKPSSAKKTAKPQTASVGKAKSSSTNLSQLSPQVRYNVGGLCACVIETFTEEGQGRLLRVLKHLDLSDMDQANLYRVSHGLRIPKLFADGLADEVSRRVALQGLSQFAKADDPTGKGWKTDLEDFARLLGG
jgi:hypothetical protein